MCVRYRLSRRKQIIAEHFDAPFDDDRELRYNIAPSQPVPVIRQTANSVRELSLMRWGLIPSWATDPSIGFKTINARSETITTTASFRDPFRTQRCLIPSDGFYSGRKAARTSSLTALKLAMARSSHSRDCGIDGSIRMAKRLRAARS